MEDLFEKLLGRLKDAKKVAIMGIGEEKLTDDGIGPYIISELLNSFDLINPINGRFLLINAGIDPMVRIEDVVHFNPTHLIIIDTCTLNKPPGTIAILERENICDYVPISTHTIPIHIVIDLIAKELPHLHVFMLGFVPESLEGFIELKQYKNNEISLEELSENIEYPFFEINLTDTLRNAADRVIELVKRLIKTI